MYVLSIYLNIWFQIENMCYLLDEELVLSMYNLPVLPNFSIHCNFFMFAAGKWKFDFYSEE